MDRHFSELSEIERLKIYTKQLRLREAALQLALLPPEKQDPTPLYVAAREFSEEVRLMGLEKWWRDTTILIRTCDQS